MGRHAQLGGEGAEGGAQYPKCAGGQATERVLEKVGLISVRTEEAIRIRGQRSHTRIDWRVTEAALKI
jgi:hypothetical protein